MEHRDLIRGTAPGAPGRDDPSGRRGLDLRHLRGGRGLDRAGPSVRARRRASPGAGGAAPGARARGVGADPVPGARLARRGPAADGLPPCWTGPTATRAPDGIWPERLGRFLYDLHAVPPELVGLRAISVAGVRDRQRADCDVLRRRRARAPRPTRTRPRRGDARRLPRRRRSVVVRAVSHPPGPRTRARPRGPRRRPGRGARLGGGGRRRPRRRLRVVPARQARGGRASPRRLRGRAGPTFPRSRAVHLHRSRRGTRSPTGSRPAGRRSSRAVCGGCANASPKPHDLRVCENTPAFRRWSSAAEEEP